MPSTRPLLTGVTAAFTCLLVACGGSPDDGTGDAASAVRDDASGAPRASEAAPPDFSAGEVAAYERGIAREIEMVQAADAAGDTATTADSRNALRAGKDEQATMAGGAQAAGLAADRYAAIRRAIHDTMRMLDYQGRIDGPTSYDTSRADAAMRERLARDPYTDLPARAAAALRAREPQVAELWGTYVRLTAVGG